ncbi:DUF1120 domain-containing protein [Pseudomonas sp. NPDC098747]|uniref:DUF1120 domain-containing protein n=1 Tax=Pseudomonas sp. NPDC098747 TaxID=3364487 RepID=UPI00383B8596
MKKLLLLPLALAFASNAAIAANSVDLRVTGTITPAACDITLVGGDVDFGSLSGSDLSSTSDTPLTPIVRNLNILCTGATQVGITAIDNRAGTNASHAYGLGVDSASEKIGGYAIDFKATTTDGSAGQLTRSNDSGATWTRMSSGFIEPSPTQIWSWAATGTNAPIPVTSVNQEFEIDASIAATNTLDTSTEITLDGSATIELVYL